MVYKFVLISDEVDNFFREIKIDADATFQVFNDAILDSVGYSKDQITAFYLCNERWEREQEISLFEMDTNSEEDSLVMSEVELREMVSEEKQRLQFVFDNVSDRAFFIELKEIILKETLLDPICSLKKGDAPTQIADINDALFSEKVEVEENFYGDEEFSDDEFDEEGFAELDGLDEKY